MLGQQYHIAKSIEVIEKPPAEMCLAGRATLLLCGKPRCPILVKAESLARHGASLDSEVIRGSSPPAVFVGRFGYPKVYIGPMVPPYYGNTEILDKPEAWMGKSVEEIVDYRFSLVRGNTRVNVFDAQAGGRLVQQIQELAMASRPVDSELHLTKKPRKTITLSEDSQPFGPSAPIRSLKSGNISADRRIEKAYYDRDLKAADATFSLYNDDVPVTRIQRAFSAGLFGLASNRKLVPTRWSITAVDSTISLSLIDQVKQHQTIDEYRIYYFTYLENRYVGLMFPEPWKFEWIEAWFPETTWNLYGSQPAIVGDYEEYWGRTRYASVGGCYYSTRIAVAEKLAQERRQAAVIFLREIHPGYLLPLGVWNVRESIRAALKTTPRTFDNLNSALSHAFGLLSIEKKNWIQASVLLQRALYQRKITEFA